MTIITDSIPTRNKDRFKLAETLANEACIQVWNAACVEAYKIQTAEISISDILSYYSVVGSYFCAHWLKNMMRVAETDDMGLTKEDLCKTFLNIICELFEAKATFEEKELPGGIKKLNTTYKSMEC